MGRLKENDWTFAKCLKCKNKCKIKTDIIKDEKNPSDIYFCPKFK